MSDMSEWEYGERYNANGEWNPRLVLSDKTGEYVEPEDLEPCQACNAESGETCREWCIATLV